MRLKKNEVAITVAGFVILFIIKVKGKNSLTKAKEYILLYFKPFLLGKKITITKVDYSVELLERDSSKRTGKKQSLEIKNDVYVKLCSNNKKLRKITAFLPVTLNNIELILRLIFYYLLKRDVSFCIHSAAVRISKKHTSAYLFLGRSGAGKSTILKLLKEMPPIYDDMGFIKKEEASYKLYVTPYKEKNEYPKDNRQFTIDKIFIIKKSSHFDVKRVPNIDFPIVIGTIANQVLVNKDRQNILDFVSHYKNNIYYLYFSKQESGLADKLLSYDFN